MLSASQIPAPAPGVAVPQHVAIIMDGNGRWAQRRHLPRLVGHRRGTNNIHPIVEACEDLGIAVLTLYAFSTENWGRPEEEVNGLMQIFLEISRRETLALHRKGVQVRQIGALEGVNAALQQAIRDAANLTRHNSGLQLNIAFNYGGRAEIVRAVRELVAEGVQPEEVTEETIARHLYTAGVPDPDLVIRTAGEMRLSNFLLWQAAYAEYYATDKLWPDFTPDDLRDAVSAYTLRKRKYGRL
jgi:undecaprenyl diphosphate synthase